MRALYRRYRPKTLDDVIGQEQVTVALKNSLKQNKIFHAYLFVGPRGTGKTSVARIFAHEINHFKYEIEDDYIDIIEIDGASNRGIDNIRELREKAAIAPTNGQYKVYIIDEVHMLTKEAFNALLKTLEEPPEHVIFIMATTDVNKVPITITSRAQTYTFKLADSKIMFNYLKSVAGQEKINITDEALRIVIKKGGGSFRDSMSLLDQISNLSDKEITADLITHAMGLPEDDKINELFAVYLNADIDGIITLLKDLFASGVKSEVLIEEMIRKIIAEPSLKLMSLLDKLANIKAPFMDAKLIVALCKNEMQPVNMTIKRTTEIEHIESRPVLNTSKEKTAEVIEIKNTVSSEPIGDFSWKNFLDKIQSTNKGLHDQLAKANYEMIGNELHIYPGKQIIERILKTEKNKNLLIDMACGLKITIHDASANASNTKKDETLARISDIMGGEVGEVVNNGGNPF